MCVDDCLNRDIFILAVEKKFINRTKEVIRALASDIPKVQHRGKNDTQRRRLFLESFNERIIVFNNQIQPEVITRKLIDF